MEDPSSEFLTAAELVDLNAIGPAFHLSGVRWRPVCEGSKTCAYLGSDATNHLWRCVIGHDELLSRQFESLAISYDNARDDLILRDSRVAGYFYAQSYVPAGRMAVLGVPPYRTFIERDPTGEFTQVQEYGREKDGTINTGNL